MHRRQHDTLIRHWYDKADMLERKKHRPDYYGILRVSAIATEGEIKAAYRCVRPEKRSEAARAGGR